MRLVLATQVVAAASLLMGCPGTEQTDPTGGSAGNGAGTEASSSDSTGTSFSTGTTSMTGSGGAGAGGSGSGAGNSGSGAGMSTASGEPSGSGGAGNGTSTASGEPTGSGGAGAGTSTASGEPTGSGGAGAGTSTATGEPTGSGGGGQSAACTMMYMDVEIQLVAAQKCFPQIDIPQCNTFVSDPCNCKVSVAFGNSPEVQAYKDALAAYQMAGCTPSCPPIPCPVSPAGSCVPSSPGSSTGTCVTTP